MDMRLKIIVVVFAIVGVFYFVQFVFGLMGKKKEHFTSDYYDEVENYEDAPKPAAAKEEEYDMRIALLEEIDKLPITDSKVKGSVMEAVFSDVSMNKLKDMSKEKRKEEIKTIYQTITTGDVKQETVIKKPVAEQVKSMFTEGSIPVPSFKDYYENDFRNKTNKALDKLDLVIKNLEDMKGILSSTPEKEAYVPDLPIPPSLPEKPESKPKPPLIEGFENIREYAFY